MFKVDKRNSRASCEIYSKLTIKIPKLRRFGIVIVNFEHISHLVLLFLLLNLSSEMSAGTICTCYLRVVTEQLPNTSEWHFEIVLRKMIS